MNKISPADISDKISLYLVKHFCFIFIAFLFSGFFTETAFGQKAFWRYVTAVTGGSKTYLNSEIKTIPGGRKIAWEKVVNPNGSAAIAFAEWDCRDKLRLTRQITFYNPDQTVIGTRKTGFEWSPVIPDSTADYLYHRVCLPLPPAILAQITANGTALRSLPHNAAPIVRVAQSGEISQIVPETGKEGWFNVVGNQTQQDYWLYTDFFRMIVTDSGTTRRKGAPAGKPAKPKRLANKN